VEKEFASSIGDLIYREKDRASLAKDIISMRQRMEDEIGRESAASTTSNREQAPGGH